MRNRQLPQCIVKMHNIASKAWFLGAEVGVSWCFQLALTSLIHLRLGNGFLVELGEEQLAGVEEAGEEE